ncbi:hypothetical protein AB685_02350 [Bacillus sp. LL01]|uniref:exonuclease domain-containing protein n=1 Tax=Bacillus sp. LL01 TaxID=1665556 RepID=UPI00064D49D4|nr:exonuclease domain-containing protein [Bacillus sp. LL01]KMJ59727.1 hypothetical protein AB685_02350 [Bacillus sp. LL01]
MKQRFVVLDLETTGNSPKKNDKIIQVGAVLIEDGEIVERFSSFVNPECSIPPFIEQLTSINQEMVDRAPTFQQIAPMLNEMLDGSSLVAHNVPFDLSFLQHELRSSGFPAFSGNTFDTVELARILLPTQKSYKLTDLSIYYQLNHDNPHRADSDAEATAIIFLKLLDKIDRLPAITIKQLHTFLHSMKSDIHLLFQTEGGTISEEYVLYQEKLVVKKVSGHSLNEKVDADKAISEQAISLQKSVGKEVRTLLESRQHGLLELLPSQVKEINHVMGALLFALEKNKKVAICSVTSDTKRSLEKLIHTFKRDAAHICTEIKGKFYYLSLPRFCSTLNDQDDNYDAVLTKAQILVWLTETETGDLEELSLSSGGKLLWESINCTYGVNKEQSKGAFCFYQKAINKLDGANIIFTNHQFLSKEIWKPDVLKELDYFLIEDANVFQQNVGKFLGKQISYLDLYFALMKLKETPIVSQAKEELDEAFRMIRSYCLSKTKKTQQRSIYRYDLLKEKSPGWFAVLEAGQRLCMKLTEVLISLDKRGTETSETGIQQEANLHPLKVMRETFHSLLFEAGDNALTWFDVPARGAKNSVTIYEQPIDVKQSLAEKFYQIKSSVLFISQALSVDNRFDYMIEELGLTDFYPKTVLCKAIEDRYTGVYIPTDMPAITRGKNETYIQMAGIQLKELLEEKGGRILVTFSSLEMLAAVYQEIKSLPNAEETVVVSQSSMTGGKQKILKAASNFDKAILLVSNSFLEEVSLSDERIDTLVVIRLPFKAMDEPVMAARIANVEGQGRNSFTDVSLPIAVLRFKKMVGTFLEGSGSKDIFIFDRRVVEKRYGSSFIDAIPNAIVKKDSFFSILDSMN